MFHLARHFPSLPASMLMMLLAVPVTGQEKMQVATAREMGHHSPDWPAVEAHLANPATSSSETLELQADILRARRFPYDALDYYGYVLQRDGRNTTVLKKVGVVQLDLRNVGLARAYFQRVIKLDGKDAQAWNNLGAVEYLQRNYISAIAAYKHAVKLQKRSAIYHSNLGMAYFDQHNYESGRKEMQLALKLDPNLFQEAGTMGVSAHVLSPEDQARFYLEMAKSYAQAGDEAEMLRLLGKAAEAGLDVAAEMGTDRVLAGYRKDPRVLVLIANAKALRSNRTLATVGQMPPLSSLSPATR